MREPWLQGRLGPSRPAGRSCGQRECGPQAKFSGCSLDGNPTHASALPKTGGRTDSLVRLVQALTLGRNHHGTAIPVRRACAQSCTDRGGSAYAKQTDDSSFGRGWHRL